MALNRCTIQGNLCRDVELSQTSNGGTYLRNTIACQRNYSKEGQEKQSDFINIVAYGKSAEFIKNYFSKGSQILIEGRIQTGSYEKQDGTKAYTTDVIVEHIYFCGSKKQNNNSNNFEQAMSNANMEFTTTSIDNVSDSLSLASDDLPF